MLRCSPSTTDSRAGAPGPADRGAGRRGRRRRQGQPRRPRHLGRPLRHAAHAHPRPRADPVRSPRGSAVDVAREWRRPTGRCSACPPPTSTRCSSVATTCCRTPAPTSCSSSRPSTGSPPPAAARSASRSARTARCSSYTGETVRSGACSAAPSGSRRPMRSRASPRRLADALAFAPSRTGTQAGYDVFAKGPFAASSYVKKVAVPDGRRRPRGVLRAVRRAPRRGLPGRRRRGDRQAALQVQPRPARVRRHDLRQLPGRPGRRPPRHVSFGANDASPGGYVDPTGLTGTGHHDLRQQRQRARQLVELRGAGRPGPAPGQPDRPVRLPVRRPLGHLEVRPDAPTRRTRRPRARTSSTSTTGSTTSTTGWGSPSPAATSS